MLQCLCSIHVLHWCCMYSITAVCITSIEHPLLCCGMCSSAVYTICPALPSLLPYRPLNNANIAFRPINPSERPFTYNDSPRLREFILATNLRLTFVDIFNSSDVTLRHLYYGVLSVTAVSRCACNGHAARCDITMTSYACQCVHNTMGTRCDQCRPLYNSKPWRAGITTDDFTCRMCECNGHASSCHYNASLDAFPNDHLSGDGGVCDDCQDNTAGQFCETCVELYFRPPGTSLDAVDVCQLCDCHVPGVTDNGDCAKVGRSVDKVHVGRSVFF